VSDERGRRAQRHEGEPSGRRPPLRTRLEHALRTNAMTAIPQVRGVRRHQRLRVVGGVGDAVVRSLDVPPSGGRHAAWRDRKCAPAGVVAGTSCRGDRRPREARAFGRKRGARRLSLVPPWYSGPVALGRSGKEKAAGAGLSEVAGARLVRPSDAR
jgi:hypothetical protein